MDEGAAPPGAGAGAGGDEEMPHDSSISYELPADICPGMKEGDEMVLKIDSIKDGKYTVSYAPEEGDGKGEGNGKGDGGDEWEKDFRSSMSPAAPDEGAQ